ncbi:hypothetical protein [Paenibacillus herberti]|uniref:Uncharacterized protein n=1 Tax=Paenibacillus herberti TaxID=1619309 RepID=A0A229P1Y2_9BACL|nr:hypothetical protein [Paenibacillus herberti]OXM15939.1 hypothetical protein CGZ75_04315 [Paenibacillus herberti]
MDISGKISDLKSKADKLRSQIFAQNEELVELSLNEDADTAATTEKVRKKLKDLRIELEETSDLIESYSSRSGMTADQSGELEKIRQAAKSEREDRLKKQKQLCKHRAALKDKLEQLNKEMQENDRELTAVGQPRETPLMETASPVFEVFSHKLTFLNVDVKHVKFVSLIANRFFSVNNFKRHNHRRLNS